MEEPKIFLFVMFLILLSASSGFILCIWLSTRYFDRGDYYIASFFTIALLAMPAFVGYFGIPSIASEQCYTTNLADYSVHSEDGVDYIYDIKEEKLINLNKYFGLDLEENDVIIKKRDNCQKLWFKYHRDYYEMK